MNELALRQARFRAGVERIIETGLSQTAYAVAYRIRCQKAILAVLNRLPDEAPGLTPEQLAAIVAKQS